MEILIGPTPDSSTTARLGDTRIFLSAFYTIETGVYTGFAYAIRPVSPPVNATYLRSQNQYGNYTGTVPTGNSSIKRVVFKLTYIFAGLMNFSSLEIIPGAVVGVVPRLDKLGYRIEASIPLAIFPELISYQVHEISFTYFFVFPNNMLGSLVP